MYIEVIDPQAFGRRLINNAKQFFTQSLKDIEKQSIFDEYSDKIGEIINTSNCISYVVTGYQYLETRLVLNFEDCKQVFDFKERGTGKDVVILVETFYTKDHSDDEKLDERNY